MLRRRKILLISGALAFFALGGAALVYSGRQAGDAENSRVPELLSALPTGAPAIVYVDLVAIRASTFYQQRKEHGPIAVPNREYADFVQSTGFDFEKDLDRAVIASWPPGLAQGQDQSGKPKMIVIAEGRFNQRKIHDYAMQKGKVEHQSGHEVFLFPASDPAKWNSIVFLNDHRIAIVEGPSIALLAEHHEDAPGNDPLRERAARVSGAAVFAISRMPQSSDKVSAPEGQSAQQLNQLMGLARSVEWVTLAARPEGSNVRISLEGECVGNAEATQLQTTLEVLRTIARGALENPKTQQSMNPGTYGVLEAILKNADITTSAKRVRILVELTPEILKLAETSKQK